MMCLIILCLRLGRLLMKKGNSFIEFMLTFIVVFGAISLGVIQNNFDKMEKSVNDQNKHIEKLTEQNKAQDVIINKLNTEYNLKGSK